MPIFQIKTLKLRGVKKNLTPLTRLFCFLKFPLPYLYLPYINNTNKHVLVTTNIY